MKATEELLYRLGLKLESRRARMAGASGFEHGPDHYHLSRSVNLILLFGASLCTQAHVPLVLTAKEVATFKAHSGMIPRSTPVSGYS